MSALLRAAGALAVAGIVAACAIPFRDYPVSPRFEGRVSGPGLDEGAEVMLRVQHHENPTLAGQERTAVGPDGSFAFAPVQLAIAGREYTKRYRAFVRLRTADGERPIWRAEFPRGEIGTPVQLDCDLSRPPTQGQPCQVVDPTRYAWLVAPGERAFAKYCVSCHGSRARGDGKQGRTLETSPPDLRRIAARNGGVFDRSAVAARIDGRDRPAAHGTSEMPAWGERLTEARAQFVSREEYVEAKVDVLVTYLESIQQ